MNGCAALAIAIAVLMGATARAQQAVPKASVGSISGVVKDVGGTPVEGAEVELKSANGGQSKAVCDADGAFELDGVPAGAFTLTVVADGLAPGSLSGTIEAGKMFMTPEFALRIATANVDVDAMSQSEVAQLQVRQEEKQRIVGAIPNFYVTYDWNAVPLNARQKVELAEKTQIDPVNFVLIGATAGIEQAQNSLSGYGPGAMGYAKRFGASYANFTVGNLLGGAILPVIFRQDPRYFYKGTGSVWVRGVYAMSTAVIAKGDNGRWQPAYANILGDLGSGAISNLYYPAGSRQGLALTFENGGWSILSDGLGNVVQEFLLKHLTPKVPKQAGQ
jgi:hypothetical protein